jgi:hypothetical protein
MTDKFVKNSNESGWQKIDKIFSSKKNIRPAAYDWQDFALKIIDELKVPSYKKSVIFQICRDYPKNILDHALIDTHELCKTGAKWRYFLKILSNTIVWDKK